MKRTLLIGIIFAFLMWIGVTVLITRHIEAKFDAGIIKINQYFSDTYSPLKIEVESFDRGLFKSTAVSTVTLEGGIQPVIVQLQHEIHHGPLLSTEKGLKSGAAYIITTLEEEDFPGVTRATSSPNSVDSPFAKLTILQTFSDASLVDIGVAALTIKQSGLRVPRSTSLGATKGRLIFNAQDNSILSGLIEIASFKLEGDTTADIGSLDIEIVANKLHHGEVLDGYLDVSLTSASLINDDAGMVAIQGIHFFASSEINSDIDNVSLLALLNVGGLNLTLKSNKVSIPPLSGHIRATTSGFSQDDAERRIDIGRQLRLWMRQKGGNRGGAFEGFYKPLLAVAPTGSSLSVAAQVDSPHGTGRIIVDAGYTGTKKLNVFRNIQELLPFLDGKILMNINKNLISGTPLEPILLSLIEAGFVIDVGEAYEAMIGARNGALNINGREGAITEEGKQSTHRDQSTKNN